MPKEILGIETRGYAKMSWDLADTIQGSRITFPSADSSERAHYPTMEIDHAFVSQSTSALPSQVLNLPGSDHYPIQLFVNLGGR